MLLFFIILIYLQANSIHATIGKNLAPTFKKTLQEGKIYVIKKFNISKNKETYAVVENNSSMIEFCFDTIVTEEDYDDNIIPQHVFNFVNFGELQNRADKQLLTG